MKKGLKIILIIVIFLYLALFFAYKNGYYRNINMERKILTEEKIQEYENDLSNGVDVSKKEYLTIKPNYDNGYTRFSLKISSKIEHFFQNFIKLFFNKISKLIDD